MRRIDKILLSFFLLVFAFRFFVIMNSDEKNGITLIALYALAAAFLFAGYWILKDKEEKSKIVPIFSGIALATSLLPLPLLIAIVWHAAYTFCFIPNFVLFLSLGIYLIVKRKSEKISIGRKRILVYSSIILGITCFLQYMPTTSAPYRIVAEMLNNGDEDVRNNMEMFRYKELFKKAYTNGNCDDAIQYAEQAKISGLLWLGLDTSTEYRINMQEAKHLFDTTDKGRNIGSIADSISYLVSNKRYTKEQVWAISGMFEIVYEAYRCKADNEFDKKQYSSAIKHYKKSYDALEYSGYDSLVILEFQAIMLHNMANCYTYTYQYAKADTLFKEAIKMYRQYSDTTSEYVGLLTDIAYCISKQKYNNQANKFLELAFSIIQKDSLRDKDLIAENYKYRADNYIQMDSSQQALIFINKVFEATNHSGTIYCGALFAYGAVLYLQDKYISSDSAFVASLECLKNTPGTSDNDICGIYYGLIQVNITLAKYDKAKEYLLEFSTLLSKDESLQFRYLPIYLESIAFLNTQLGSYKEAEAQYEQFLEIYNTAPTRINDLYKVLIQIALFDITTGKLDAASRYAQTAISGSSRYIDQHVINYAQVANDEAYILYRTGQFDSSDTLYNKALNINKIHGRGSSTSKAIALNGLGLIRMAQHKYKTADSLFANSLAMHLNLLGDNNPLTAAVYLNYGILKTNENALGEASAMLDKAEEIDSHFLKPDHDVFGDIDIAKGDLSLKQSNRNLAKEYYQKALSIYMMKFGDAHYKTLEAAKKVKSV
jgi:tetratricopeptide (TPR) repeat protein